MTEIQDYLLKLVLEIYDICEAHGIEYVLFGGASLGIERNEGFLPWDDDLDLLMTKDNYLKFIEVMKEEKPEGRVIESPEVNEEFPLHFGKYMSTETSGIIRSLAYGNSSAGIWIDIFYLCPLAKDPAEAAEMLGWFQVFCEFQNNRFAEVPIYVEGLYERYKRVLRMSKLIGRQKTLKWLEKKFDYVKEEDCDKYFLHHALTKTVKVYSKRHMQKIVRRSFEGHMLPFCATNREISREAYGDEWMMVPDVPEQEVHDAILDTGVPFSEYINDYMQYLDKDEVDKDLLKYKKSELYFRQNKYKVEKEILELDAILKAEEINRNAAEKYRKIKDKDDARSEFAAWFEELEESIGARKFASYDIIPEPNPSIMVPYLEHLIRIRGKWTTASLMLADCKKISENDRASLDRSIDFSRRASIARYDLEDMEAMDKVIKEYREEDDGHMKEIDMAEIVLAYYRKEFDRMKTLCEENEEIYGETDVTLMARAALCNMSGDEQARNNYIEKIKETSCNGLLLLNIRNGVYGF